MGPVLLVGLTGADAKENGMEPLVRKEFGMGELVEKHPPKVKAGNIRIPYEVAGKGWVREGSKVVYSRWEAMTLPAGVEGAGKMEVEGRADFFTYDPPAGGGVKWHLNFADPDVFAYYGSGLFAQDEMQVAEHPVLASLREALVAEGLSRRTVEDGKPTPILVRGVPRAIKVATEPSAAEGRPGGLYGNAFSRAAPETVRRAVTKLEPATVSNIVAVVAPSHGSGEYTGKQVEHILTTAYTGFQAAKIESGRGAAVTIHTGFWGCGAFGGNRELMVILQLHAARLAGVDRVVFHAGDKGGLRQFEDGRRAYERFAGEAPGTRALVGRVVKCGYRWGVSDGN
jgi:hypothetical protein